MRIKNLQKKNQWSLVKRLMKMICQICSLWGPTSQLLATATTLTGREGAPWEALHTALYWAQGSPNGPDTPEPTEAWVRQAKAMRNYHLHHPFDDSPAALPWPTDPPETVRKLADIIRSHAKAKMQTPAEPPLRDPDQQATHPFFQPHAPPAPPPPVPPK